MACVENIPPGNEDSEMEEGEIVDDLDDLSDISSEEEFLLRQRLQVLENYNNVLERKKAKRSSFDPGLKRKVHILQDLSEISETELDDKALQVIPKVNVTVYRNAKDTRYLKQHKQKKRKDLDSHNFTKYKDSKKKTHRKKRLEVKIISETSEESDDEYRNKRRKLAVAVNKDKCDTSSLQARIQKMLCGKNSIDSLKTNLILTKDQQTETDKNLKDASCSPMIPEKQIIVDEKPDTIPVGVIDLSTDDDVTIVLNKEISQDTVDAVTKENQPVENKAVENKAPEGDSDEDLELLRQHALKTKMSKTKEVSTSVPIESENKPSVLTEDEDSDTEELRMICLKSALLKKAIEMKQKQKLRKRLSQSSNLIDEFLGEENEFVNKTESQDNTDIESVDMDIGSDADEKAKDFSNDSAKVVDVNEFDIGNKESLKKDITEAAPKVDELEEDEDLLRAQLLTSLSKNLPKLVDTHIIEALDDAKVTETVVPPTKPQVPNVPEKRIIINLGESDSEGEHEATKNLTKMHIKLSEQKDFQQKLDMLLKSARMEVEKQKPPAIVHEAQMPKTPQKFIAKAVNHLPKSEQIEYKNLVKRMAELEKIKQVRQTSITLVNKTQIKETLKPRNVSVDQTQLSTITNLEEQIALSRKIIAEESAKIMKLKEEATKLSQKYKIVATELRNINTAITLNKKEQRSVHNKLSKIRIQHQRLLQSSTSKHSKANGHVLSITRPSYKSLTTNKLQKENNPAKEDYKNPNITRTVKVSVPNRDETASNPILSVQVDLCNNKKTIIMPNPMKRVVDIQKDNTEKESIDRDDNSKGEDGLPVVNIIWGNEERRKEFDDYESPLQAFETASWQADPNAILCPFEVGGNCKDPDCKYLHPKTPSIQ